MSKRINYQAATCPTCDDYPLYECTECGLEILNGTSGVCDCLMEMDEVIVHCHSCNTAFPVFADDVIEEVYSLSDLQEDLDLYEDEYVDALPMFSTTITRHTWKCRHRNYGLQFPDETWIFASSLTDREPGEQAPDFGLYLDTSWRPACLAYQIEWPDYGIPQYWETAAMAIIDVFKKSRDHDMWVEVGCIGGHGRTGTALACMGVLSGMSPAESISYVRDNYCRHAIETDRQKWWVSWFDAFVNGGSTTSPPVWSKADNDYLDGPTFEYSTPFYWNEWEITDDPVGCPAMSDQQVTTWDEYSYDEEVRVDPQTGELLRDDDVLDVEEVHEDEDDKTYRHLTGSPMLAEEMF